MEAETGNSHAVEFVGGPFDGYRQAISFPAAQLAEMVLLPVNDNILRLVQGKHCGPKAAPTSVAMYELEGHEGHWRYRYWWATSPEVLQLQDWLA
jgi:hypothetical protein